MGAEGGTEDVAFDGDRLVCPEVAGGGGVDAEGREVERKFGLVVLPVDEQDAAASGNRLEPL